MSLKNILDLYKDENDRFITEGVPIVGPFYIISGKIYTDGLVSVRDARFNIKPGAVLEGFASSTYLHGEMWSKLMKEYPELHKVLKYNSDPEFAPRGRVLYEIAKDKYIVMIDKCFIKNITVKNKIISTFSLPYDKTVFKNDIHYRCEICR